MNGKKVRKALAFHIPVVLLSIVMIYPLAWMIASSLKENSQIFTQAHSLIANPPHWENYVKGWQGSGRYTYATYFSNSAFVTILSTIGAVASSSLVAFGFARIPFKKKNLWFALLMGTMLLPSQVLVVPQYMVFKSLGWLNTYLPPVSYTHLSNAPGPVRFSMSLRCCVLS